MKKSDFSEADLKRLEDNGFDTSTTDFGAQFWVSQIPVDTPMSLEEYEEKYSSAGASAEFKELSATWDDAYRMRWTKSVITGDGYVTVVGIQHGDTIELCKDLDQSSIRDVKITDSETFEKAGIPSHRNVGAMILIALHVLIFAGLGILNLVLMLKEKKAIKKD